MHPELLDMEFQPTEPIAIVGSGCRFPGGANSPSALWKLLVKPWDVVKEIPNTRFNTTGYYHHSGAHHGTSNVKHSYLLDEDIRTFDAQFFNINPVEADSMDPQQRLLMETVFESVESAGLTIEGLRGSDTSVFVGVMSVDYQDILIRDIKSIPTYQATGVSRSILSNRISYFFDWRGPSMTIDTACSSSMVAVHQAVQALRNGESNVAIAAGTELILGPENYVAESKMNLLSPTGRSRMWDADADGYARGDGIAAVVLKKLKDALRDGDHIECIIRETGVNQDGRTNGLTVPSSEAQASLIRRTYARAGLDITDPRDQPQFFEAHGTGTKVGDPREAAAIEEAFFSNQAKTKERILHVGSIKTIIGHTEGTAGVAGLLKGSLALQHGIIPPNLLFNRLNPSVKPYYTCLKIPEEATPWPTVPDGCVRRVSVNSFGFGGTNGHAILESYTGITESINGSSDEIVPFTPFTFSAVSETALVSLLKAYSNYLKAESNTNIRDLAWTLQSRRSVFPVKVSFSGINLKHLASKIDTKLEEAEKNPETPIGLRVAPGEARVLGIFTGQGAQWATMGGDLIRSSTFVCDRIKHLDESLAALPETDRPAWLISTELLANKSCSRIGEAELSQPLCTAIQIILVDLLQAAGLKFSAVVGHSSGEIAAAYAAGFISDHDAIRIAYYRGLNAKQASLHGCKGAMLAVGTSLEDAQQLCELPEYKSRLCVAAHNSSASITLSGDVDAIEQAKSTFKEKNTFVRQLMVDTAYHSHHMLPFGDAYIESLRGAKINVNTERKSKCVWYSSVVPGKVMEPTEDLRDTYWRDNLVKPVMFAEAVTEAAKTNITMGIEIGPHPALKAPATQIISEVRGTSLPYYGVLSRGNNDIESFSDCLGFIWTQFGRQAVEFDSVEKLLARTSRPKLLKGLPSYQWEHSRIHWHESRISRKTRARSTPYNEILGFKSPESTEHELRWTNLLKPSEIRWLNGHQLQGQIVFPAAGYIAMAIEASKSLAGEKEVKYFEVHDLVIKKAITFDDDSNFAVETLVTLTGIISANGVTNSQKADFCCYSCVNGKDSDLELVASGSVKVIYGKAQSSTLPSTPSQSFNMNPVDGDRFYSALQDLGYGYTGPFKGLSGLKRKLDYSTALISSYVYGHPSEFMIVHPTTLDVAFQAAFLAQSSPGDQRLWALHVPVSIQCVRVNAHLSGSLPLSGTTLPVDATLAETSSISILGDINIYSEDHQHTIIQVEGLTMVPFSAATAADDRCLFSHTKWIPAAPTSNAIAGEDRASSEELELATLSERLGYYYLRKWKAEISEDEWTHGKWHHQRLRDYVNHLLTVIEKGEHPHVRKEWAEDSISYLQELVSKYPASVDLKLISAVGENMPAVVRGETTILEHMMKDNMLDDLYKHGIGAVKYNTCLAAMAQQISSRYPHMKILEIGAGTGSATKSVLKSLGTTFSSYTYTDVSTAFFEKASNMLKDYSHKMIFKSFDVERTPASQGFEEHTYDMIIASNVLHATKSLQTTLENTRRLLKPGGYLLMLEITNNGPIRFASMTSGLPGWWVGIDDGRVYTPTVSAPVWDRVLKSSGFSGTDTTIADRDGLVWPFSVISTQAVDWRVNFIREPLSFSPRIMEIEQLVILGTELPETSVIAKRVAGILRKYCKKITILRGLPLEDDLISSQSTFLNLVDLDEPVFKNLTTEKMNGIKRLLNLSKNILWVTKGCQDDQPYHMASVGFGRTICHEMPHLRLQFLDLDDLQETASHTIVETLLRLISTGEWESKGEFGSDVLWTTEPELMVQRGQLLLPRLLPNNDQNARLNSRRRFITKDVNLRTSIVSLSRNSKSVALLDESLEDKFDVNHDLVAVSCSILPAVRVSSKSFLFLGIGTMEQTGQTVAYLSETNSSKAVPAYCSGPAMVPRDKSQQFLSAILGHLMVASFIEDLPNDSTILIHEPDPAIVPILLCEAKTKNIHVLLSTVSTGRKDTVPWIYLQPLLSKRKIKSMLPSAISHFVDLSVDGEAKEVGSQVSKVLGSECVSLGLSNIFRGQSLMQKRDTSDFSARLQNAVAKAEKSFSEHVARSITVGKIGELSISEALTPIVIDWSIDNVVSVQIQPSSSDGLFSKNKTYLLVGLTGQLGQSLCEWMARNGAGYVCLASRSPEVEEEWIKSVETHGTTVRIFKLDIANKEDLQRVYDEISSTLPPIAGVANAAMVLHDMEFAQMPLDMMKRVWAPKIDGSNYLDELFYNHDLEFFVLFSSLSFVYGNTGQASYASANGYLNSLVSQRRKRGSAASVIDISQLAGMGYVERTGHVLQDRLLRYGFMRISESDFHEMIAETIRAGRPKSKSSPVVTIGVRAARDDEEVKVPWFANPRLSHFIVEANTSNVKATGKKINLPVSDQLRSATNEDGILEILRKHVSAQLQHILHLPSDKVNHEVSLVELGVDSLAAVEVRSWILRELKTDVPVLQVLGSDSVADLCRHILEKLPDKLSPNGDTKGS